MEQFKGGVDAIRGWLVCFIMVGILWLICLRTAFDEYFMLRPLELTKLVVALFGTVIIWFLNLFLANRDWLRSQQEAMKWQAEHDLRLLEKLDNLTIGKLQEIHNIVNASPEAAGFGDVIGEG